jgi:sigma-E factor negative regulatory protein RseC
MEEEGIVIGVEGVTAVVRVVRKGACEHCTAGTCDMTEQGAEITALNPVGARVGQRVRVVMHSTQYLKGSMIVYGLPVLALMVGAVVGKIYGPRLFPGLEPDLAAAIAGFGLMALSLLGVKVWSTGAEKKTEYQPVIEQVLDASE